MDAERKWFALLGSERVVFLGDFKLQSEAVSEADVIAGDEGVTHVFDECSLRYAIGHALNALARADRDSRVIH